MEQLGEADLIKSNILTRLFKLCFMSVNIFPTTNEGVLLPHLNHLILESLRLGTKAEEPIVYSYLQEFFSEVLVEVDLKIYTKK